MKCLLSVSLTAALAVVAELAMCNLLQSRPLQKGVSVQMAASNNAVAMPEADNENAWIVAVTADGRLYFGTRAVSAASLTEQMKATPRNRDQKLYIKADARTPFADVQRVLHAGKTVWFEAPVLLTTQREPSKPGTIVPPEGLEVLVGAPSGTESFVVQVSRSEQISPRLTVNGADVPDASFAGTLAQMLSGRSEKMVVLKADGELPFAQVVHVIDMCRSQGVKVAVDGPEI